MYLAVRKKERASRRPVIAPGERPGPGLVRVQPEFVGGGCRALGFGAIERTPGSWQASIRWGGKLANDFYPVTGAGFAPGIQAVEQAQLSLCVWNANT